MLELQQCLLHELVTSRTGNSGSFLPCRMCLQLPGEKEHRCLGQICCFVLLRALVKHLGHYLGPILCRDLQRTTTQT